MSSVLVHSAVAEEAKLRLQKLYAQSDPVILLAEIHAAQAGLGELRIGPRRGRDASSRHRTA
jgi:hypothetical protein